MILKRFIGMAFAAAALASSMVQAQPLIVAVDTAFVPFEFKQDGKYVGFDVDLWDAIATELQLEYQIQPMDFNGIIPALQTGNVDVALAGITIKEERKKVIDFSTGYYDSGLLLMVPVNSPIQGADDLPGKSLAVKSGTSGFDFAKASFKETELRQFPNIDNAYLELQTGRVDAVLHDSPNVLYYVAHIGKGRVKVTGAQLMAHPYGIGFPKGSELVPRVNEALAHIKADGRYAAIYRKWLGVEPPKS